MPWTLEDMPDQLGRIAVVTGANGGLGLATARALAGRRAHVVMAARNQQKAADAHRRILEAHPEASLEIVELDLGSLASVERAATEILERHDRVDLLVNNAGLMAMPERRTEDGFDMQFGVNHLGHWALTSHLLPTIVRTPGARVVTVSSTAQHYGRGVDPDDPFLRDGYAPWRMYGQSKLANRHFAMGLQRQFEEAGVDAMSLACHPGLTNSDLQATTVDHGGGGVLGPFFHRLTQAAGMSISQGALSQLRAATDPDADPHLMYGPLLIANGPPIGKPMVRPGTDAAIATLWEVSREQTGLDVDVRAALAATP